MWQQLGTRELWAEGVGEGLGGRGAARAPVLGTFEGREAASRRGTELARASGGAHRWKVRSWGGQVWGTRRIGAAGVARPCPQPDSTYPARAATIPARRGLAGLSCRSAPPAPRGPRLPLAAAFGTRLTQPISVEKRGLETFSS